ncbi:MAG TPA: class I SAM-dependent methyltransferase [Dyella sp.]|uniref:class I SAM-dependent methyltransferase n=1 Tax=Dyella sp. TaxID=1869338 RepID=UPI002D76AD5D|nr:class I SAM-dependent methyltransferase [Dyella sp.]HET6553511.1 class I SAM-dependent methyltransferase [Dyella sp.]
MSSYDHEHFERLYTHDPDPWAVLTSTYERDKYQATLHALSRPRYAQALELGCSIGGLTRWLAPRCQTLVAVDTSETALQRARSACPAPQVKFVQAHLPDGDWQGTFDLVVLSEILYYFSVPALAQLAERLSRMTTAHTDFVVVHWTGETDYPLSGDCATELFRHLMYADVRMRMRNDRYRLETWSPGLRSFSGPLMPHEATRNK